MPKLLSFEFALAPLVVHAITVTDLDHPRLGNLLVVESAGCSDVEHGIVRVFCPSQTIGRRGIANPRAAESRSGTTDEEAAGVVPKLVDTIFQD